MAIPTLKQLQADLRSSLQGEVHFDTQHLALYATDASNYRYLPVAVVFPRTTEDVIQTVEVCRHHDIPVLSRGGGTGLAGQTVNHAVIMDFTRHLNHILAIDPQAKTATVQPGVVLDSLRDEASQKYQLTYGPDPATHNHCTFGGMIGNDSCGVHSIMAGRTADNVIEMEVLTYDGTRMRVGQTTDQGMKQIVAEGGRRGEIYAGLLNIRSKYADLIRSRYPKIPRRVSGYNLDNLLPERGTNVAQALVGSEATLVTILEATVRLVYSPPKRAMLLLGYEDIYSAGDDVPRIMEFKPVGLEAVDELLIDYMKREGLHPDDIGLLPSGTGWLIVEFGGDTTEEAVDHAQRAVAAIRQSKPTPSIKLYSDVQSQVRIWEIRESGLGATAHVPGLPITWEGWEDAAVPPDRVGAYLRKFRELMHKHGYEASLYGHFGQGCIHCRINFDLMSEQGIKNYMSFIDEAADLVIGFGGVMSGEHGDGQSKAKFLTRLYGEDLYKGFQEYKQLFDPTNKMNPGKIVNAYQPDQNLRLGAHYNPWEPQTHFKFPDDDGSFAKASLRCVGVGKCRRSKDAFMCPSFLATNLEKDNTRGRARLLWEMLEGSIITNKWQSEEVRDSLDLCLGCKGCKAECPTHVDMATYKAEFLSHYYEGRLHPRPAYSMGLIGYWAKPASRVPWLVNFFTQTPGLRALARKVAGISSRRAIPAFAPQSFTSWYRKERTRYQAGKQVVLMPDAFNDYFYPDTLKAALYVLEELGYHVIVPDHSLPVIRPLLHYGMLAVAERKLVEAMDLLQPYTGQGISVVFLEPSAASVYRDEMRQLFPDREGVRNIRDHCLLLSEFLEQEQVELPHLDGKAILHIHCHEKAVLNPNASREVLKKLGLEVIEPQVGCCGMAGSFGLEEGHYDVSMKIGNEHLFPAIESAEQDTYIVAHGFSCRTQIKDGTGRDALHFAELVARAFELGRSAKTEPAEVRTKTRHT